MKSAKKFNKFYTTSTALASISMLLGLLAIIKNLNLESIVLFFLLIGASLFSFIYSLGYFGGRKQGYGFSSFINIASLLTVLLVMLSEIEAYLYLSGFKVIVTVVIVQIFLILVISAVLKLKVLNNFPHHNS